LAELTQEGNQDYALQLETNVQFYARENLTFDVYLEPLWSRDWLIWQRDDLLASFVKREIAAGLDVDWFPARGHELRVKLQWLSIDAYDPTPFRIGPGGQLVESTDAVAPFTVNNFGLQVRYRWTFAPQSDLYVVYGRGGFELTDDSDRERSATGLLRDAFELRDADQFLVKVRYRF
jgi:Domain of unknown function (DUF5916)